jgi:membrane-associated protease RseP (regulator of RpoE activity)
MSIQKDPLSDVSRKKSIIAVLVFVAFSVYMLIDSEKSRNVYWVILALIGMILVHEAGHLTAAKLTKMKATEYFAGFGPKLWSFKKGETEYGLKAIPLGGYVKIIGMSAQEEIAPEDEARTYRSSKTWKKLFVISAGVLANFITAFVLLFGLFSIHGVEDASISKNQIASVSDASPAAKSGLQPDDKILSINGDKIKSFEDISKKIKDSDGKELVLKVKGDEGTKEVLLTPEFDDKADRYLIGIVAKIDTYRTKLGVLESGKASIKSVNNVITLSVKGFGQLFTPKELKEYSKTVASGDTSVQERPSSLVGIVDVGAEVTKNGWVDFLLFVATINIAIGALNAMPLLPLDGGHALIAIYEKIASIIARKKVVASYKFLISFSSVVLVVILALFASSAYLDVRNIITR